MSLFGSIQIASNSLIASSLGLQVTGNNIANANTPGYLREELVLTPAPVQHRGDLILGLGVQVEGVIHRIDKFLEERLRGATSDLTNSEVQENVYRDLESLLGELGDNDLSTALNEFFGSVHDVLNQPESRPVRNLAVLQGQTLAQDIRRLDERARTLYSDLNDRVNALTVEINQLVEEIARLNVQIVSAEGGGTRASDAVNLRDRRYVALSKLSEIVNVRVFEQPTGSVSVFSGGDFLVFDGTFREVEAIESQQQGQVTTAIHLKETNAPIDTSSGRLAGLLTSRDEILGGFIDSLNEFARSLLFEFNKVHSGGQGLVGHTQLTSEFAVDDADLALDQAGLTFAPVNGSFQVQVFNKQTGTTETTDVFIDLNGLEEDSTLNDLADTFNSIDGLTAEITPSRRLTISTDSENLELALANDTSGVLAALGINTFFSGSTSSDIGVKQLLLEEPSKFAASKSGIGADTENAVQLAALLDAPLESENGSSLSELYGRLTGNVTQGSAVAQAVAEGFRTFQKTLLGDKLAFSGVNLDEEAVRMITFQRTFQASARLIATVNELLEVLVNL